MSAERKINVGEVPDIVPSSHDERDLENVPIEKQKGADILLNYVQYTNEVTLNEATNKMILRKTDIHILPWLCGLYILQFLDKGVLSYSSVMGILTDANLTSSQYNWLGSIYYLGYLVVLPIHNRLFQVFAPSRYIAANMTLWGITLCTMAACNDFTSLMVQRCFLGTFEAVVNCGFVLLTARWYNKYEHGARVSLWSGCNGIAGAIGAIVAFGCLAGSEDGLPVALASWKIMALCLGAVSIVYGLSMFFFMAPSLLDAKFFTEEEKVLAAERLRENNSGLGSDEFKWYQAREAFVDIRTWLYVLVIVLTQIPSAGLSLLSSLIIKSLDFNSKQTLLLNIPSGALQVFFQWTTGFIADWSHQRALTAIAIQIFALFGALLFVGLSTVGSLYDRAGQLAAYYIMSSVSANAYFLLLAIVASNVIGTTKKTTTNVILFISMAVAYLVGPQCFTDPPYYIKGRWLTVGMWAGAVIILLVLYVLNRWENTRRERWLEEHGAELPKDIEFMDFTDKENRKFRYVL